MTDQFKQNRLGDATSPYLQQHKDNPVHWQPWGADVFQEAKRRNVPVLLSIGYAACHWCHVMAHESFEDDAVAELMNTHFVCIKLDREERPDLDEIYMGALALMGEQGGWPLTICLDHEAKPFWGGTYFPKTPQYGRPGFMQILTEISRVWRETPEKIASNTQALAAALKTQAEADARGDMPVDLPAHAAKTLTAHIDMARGGLTGAPKFPQPFLYRFLWQQAEAQNDAAMYQAVITTLDKICLGGIYDHLAGGFARYSVDADWLVPHFEKMLYDNALLIGLMTQVWRRTRAPLLKEHIIQSIDWLKAEMTLPNGAFAASLDADTQGEEGRFYVWQRHEIDSVLGPQSDAFCAAYGVTEQGNFEGQNILNLLAHEATAFPRFEALADARATLLATRRGRPAPPRDEKILADWNGMMIAALAEAACVFDRPDWLHMAEQAYKGALAALNRADGGLSHSARNGQTLPICLAADLAFFGQAALALYQATGATAYLAAAEGFAASLLSAFHDADLGAFRTRATTQNDDGLVNAKPYQDNAMPSANAAVLQLFSDLHCLTGKPAYEAHAADLFAALSGHLAKNYPSMTALLSAHMASQNPLSIIIVGRPGPARAALVTAARQHAITTRCILVFDSTQGLGQDHPAYGKTAQNAAPTAYICPGQSCLAPLSDADMLNTQLDALLAARHS